MIDRETELSQEEIQDFFQLTPDLLCIADLDGNFIKINKAWTETLGYTQEKLHSRKFLDFLHPDDMEDTLSAMSVLESGKEVFNYVNRYKTKDGDYRYIEWRARSKGKFIYAAARDVTDRKKIEDASHRVEAIIINEKKRLENIITGTRAGTWEWNVQSGETVFNERWAEMLGYSLEEISPVSIKTWEKFSHPDDFKKSGQLLEKHFAGELDYYEFESRMKHRDGHWIWVLDRGKVLEWTEDGKPLMMAGTHQDITEQKKAEKDIEDSKMMMDMFFSQSLTGFFFMILDEPVAWNDSIDKEKTIDYVFDHHRITKINQAMLDQYGAREEEFIGLTPNDLFSHDMEHGRKTWMDFFNNGRLHVETSEQKMDGSPIQILGDYICIYDEEGRITGHFGVQTDVTELKFTQEKLAESKRLAEEASHAKSLFLANMSHEIRTPLNGVIGFTDLLRHTDLNPVQKQYAENANTSGHALLGIINDILDFSKIEAGMMELDITKSNVAQILENSVDIIKFQAGKKNLEVLLNIDHSVPKYAMLDSIRVKQVLANLLSNAVKFTPTGEIELHLEYDSISANQGKFRFSVRDTGIGISEEERSRLFKAFSQADSATTREFGGTGLGLVISDMIVRKMGGEILLTSEKGKGSCFSFEIESEVFPNEKSIPSNGLKIKRCLLVDDNKSNIMILEHMLGAWGIQTDICRDGVEALQTLEEKGAYDIIICDYHMPKMNGLELIQRIRQDLNLTPDKQPILLLHSSSDDMEIYNACKELGIYFRLTKPVKINDLHQYLHNLNEKMEWNSERNRLNDIDSTEQKKIDETEEDSNMEHSGNLESGTHTVVGGDRVQDVFSRELKVLVAEDNEMNFFLIQSFLKKLSHSIVVLEASDGKQALEFYKKEKPDLILMDIQMPIMDGITATEEIRKMEKDSGTHTPIIALTAGAFKEEQERCLNAGMDDFLTKPMDRKKVKETLEKHI